MANLQRALQKVKANKGAAGIDNQTIEMFENHLEENLEKIAKLLREDKYQAQAIKRVWIPKAASKEKRPLAIRTVRVSSGTDSTTKGHRANI
jgi:RNA-directed DNA polymerase